MDLATILGLVIGTALVLASMFIEASAGGISMFESVCSKNFTLVTELYENQKYSIKKLKELNMISIIGKNTLIYKKKLIQNVKNVIKLKNNNKIKYPKNFNLIDGKSILRIENIIFKIINKRLN